MALSGRLSAGGTVRVFRPIGPGSVVVSGGHTSYRHGERFARAIDLSGPRVLAGVQWQW